MPYPQPFAIFLLLTALLAACAPPWRGEECNYHIAAVTFRDSLDFVPQPISSLGYTRVQHLERSATIDAQRWAEVEELNFRQYDPTNYLLLPLDVESNISTFVLEHPDGNDTLVLTYNRKVARDSRGHCGYAFNLILANYEWTGHGIYQWDEPRHPRIVYEAELIR
ncbi:MAG: hypothetical protein AAGN35_09755 [Bacteroidota bacterium]